MSDCHTSPSDDLVFAVLLRAARAGEPCPTNDKIAAVLGMSSISGPSRVVQRLEDQGRIRVKRFQIGRIVTVLADPERGIDAEVSTKAPENQTPHWRDLADRPLPALPLHVVTAAEPDLARFIILEADNAGTTCANMILKLLKIGAVQWMAEKAEAA